jgi:hypothetical protein
MRKLKNILVASFLTVGAFTSMMMVSCNPDPCRDVVCNNGVCDDVTGSCKCDAGYEGSDCSTRTKKKFLGSYKGNGSDDQGGTYTNWKLVIGETDTTNISAATFTIYNATDVQQMSFTGNISSTGIITLDNKTTTNFIYTNGLGSVIAGSSASITFKEADNPGGTNPYVYSFTNMAKQ